MADRSATAEADDDTSRLLNSGSGAADIETGDEAGDSEKQSAKSLAVESAASKNFMKNVSLALLSVQNCAMILSMKYSKSKVLPGEKSYLSTTAVVVVRSGSIIEDQ
jgi:hypothetical protein